MQLKGEPIFLCN